jgi:hypothetical protein
MKKKGTETERKGEIDRQRERYSVYGECYTLNKTLNSRPFFLKNRNNGPLSFEMVNESLRNVIVSELHHSEL